MQILRVDPNVNYTVKFRAKASATTTIETNVQQNHDQYLSQGADIFSTVTPSWHEYSYYFSSSATTTDKVVQLIFALGYTNSATYWIDDVELIPDNVSTIRVPSFETSDNGINDTWSVYIDDPAYGNSALDCDVASEGACSEKFTINQTTAADWIMQFYQPQSLVAGQTYVLTFDAKASSQRNADVYLQQNHDDLLSAFRHRTVYASIPHGIITLSN